MWRGLALEFGSGVLNIPPAEEYGFAQAADAFRDMANARHNGKVVLTRRPGEAVQVLRGCSVPRVAAESAYLITGGTGAVGLLAAQWLIGQGARHIVLAARGEGSAE